MKISIFLTAAVLAAAGWFGWKGHLRMDAVLQRQQLLEKQAAVLDLSGNGPDAAIRSRNHRKPEVDAKALAAELLADTDRDPDLEKACRDLSKLDDKGMGIFVAGIFSAAALGEEQRGQFVIALMMALSDRPQTALLLFDRFSDAGGKPDHRGAADFIPSALEKWATRDPSAALNWLREKGKKHPEFVTGAARCRVLTSVAASDPERAFREIGNVGIGEPQDAVRAIMRAGTTPEQRLSVLTALRGYLTEIPDGRLREERSAAAMSAFAGSAVSGGEAAARQWIASARFRPAEMNAFAAGIARETVRPEEIGKWIECLAAAGAGTFPGQPVHTMVERWTKHDYQAAGGWLATTADGPAKRASVQAYAETVSKYDPRIAEEWALTLPVGEGRRETLLAIHRNWPEDDAVSKDAFAAKHGIK